MTAPFPVRPDEAVRRAQLENMKRWATILVVIAAAIFAGAFYYERSHPWLGYVRATAEAAVVGGLADWFAVTALFRHPLGLPIPHTAIVGRQKDRIGRILGNFVQQYFLSREAVTLKLRDMRLAERAARWLSDPTNAQRIAVQVAGGVARAIEALPDDKIREMIQQGATDRIRATRVAPMLGRTLAVVVAGDRHQQLLDETLRLAAQAVRDNQELIRQRVRAESPWWVPSAVDNKIYLRIVGAIEHLLRDISAAPDHPVRARFDSALREFVERLQHSPEAGARADAIKNEWLSDEAVAELTSWFWDSTRAAVTGYASKVEGSEPGPMARGLSAFGASMLENERVLAEIEAYAIEIMADVIEEHRHEVADLIARTVSRWDPEATSQRLELALGSDLQFVRINGTLVGGLVGLAIYSATRLFP